jgi:dipeptidase E
MYWFNKSGLSKILPKLLKTRIYIGVSAGSIIATPSLINADFEAKPLTAINEEIYHDGLSLVDFMVEPHINSPYFPESTFKNLKTRSQRNKYSIYGIDDETAIKIDGDKLEVVSQGVWKKFEK